MVKFILAINLLIAFKIWWDWRAKSKGRIINHLQSAGIDVALYSLLTFVLFDLNDFLGILVLALSYRWIVFDIAFNLVNGWSWDHLGNSSKLDLFLKKFKYPIVIKLIPIIFGVCLLLLL
jgi:hypothetical protein